MPYVRQPVVSTPILPWVLRWSEASQALRRCSASHGRVTRECTHLKVKQRPCAASERAPGSLVRTRTRSCSAARGPSVGPALRAHRSPTQPIARHVTRSTSKCADHSNGRVVGCTESNAETNRIRVFLVQGTRVGPAMFTASMLLV